MGHSGCINTRWQADTQGDRWFENLDSISLSAIGKLRFQFTVPLRNIPSFRKQTSLRE